MESGVSSTLVRSIGKRSPKPVGGVHPRDPAAVARIAHDGSPGQKSLLSNVFFAVGIVALQDGMQVLPDEKDLLSFPSGCWSVVVERPIGDADGS